MSTRVTEPGSTSPAEQGKSFLVNSVFSALLLNFWAAITCLFLEGKSAYDLAFTLWDDRFAKVPMEPMGEIILPQIVYYAVFFVITAAIVAFFLSPARARPFTIVMLVAGSVLVAWFSVAYGEIQAFFAGNRQGPVGWTILMQPWVSTILLCVALALGLVGTWLLVAQEVPAPGPRVEVASLSWWRQWFFVSNAWRLRLFLLVGTVTGVLTLNGALILGTGDANAALVSAACSGLGALAMASLAKRPFSLVLRKRRVFLAKNLFQLTLFSRSEVADKAGTIHDMQRAWMVNPRNLAWRRVRNVLNGAFTAGTTAMIAAIAFMTVPDEWVFERAFVLLPWMLLGMLLGLFTMSIVPEPSLFMLPTFFFIFEQYDAFLADYSLPFSESFVIVAGLLLGFWIAATLATHFYMYRAHDIERNYFLTIFLSLAFTGVFLLVCFVDRFQHDGQMVQEPITEVMVLLELVFMTASTIIPGVTIVFWLVDLGYRVFRWRYPRKPLLASNLPAPRPRKPLFPVTSKIAGIVRNKLPPARQKIIAIAMIAALGASFAIVQGTVVYPARVRPLLVKDDVLGIWSVEATVKVERSFRIDLSASAPAAQRIEISAARGEWEGWHVLVSPREGRTIVVTSVNCSDFVHATLPTSIDHGLVESFLVAYLVDEQPDQLLEIPPAITRAGGEHVDLFWRVRVPVNASAGSYTSTITLIVSGKSYSVPVALTVFNFTLPQDNHLRTAFGGGWTTPSWFDELSYLRISQYDMGIPFTSGVQYWWNGTAFEFNWAAYDAAFQAQLDRGFTGVRQGYFPSRPASITNDTLWRQIQADFVQAVSAHLESRTWTDQIGRVHSWVELPYNYWTDEPPVERYQHIHDVNALYHSGTSKLRTLLTEEYRAEYPILHDVVDIWCPVIGNFEPSAVTNRHAAGQEYWFYVCVGPTAPYPNMQLWEAGHDPRLLPYICARFNADGFLYWSMTASNDTYRAGFDGNGDGQLCFRDPRTSRPLPSLRLLSFSAGVEDFEYIWLMRTTVAYQNVTGPIPSSLLGRVAAMEVRLNQLVGERPQFINHDYGQLVSFRTDLAALLEDLWPYSQHIYS
ncbi:MAG: glycoside hydrolase domain-containing protein [Candidatus Sigynarchaeota archaeon]